MMPFWKAILLIGTCVCDFLLEEEQRKMLQQAADQTLAEKQARDEQGRKLIQAGRNNICDRRSESRLTLFYHPARR